MNVFDPDRFKLEWSAIDAARDELAVVIGNPNLPDCPLIFANQIFVENTGYAMEDLIGRNCRFLQGPLTEASAKREIKAAVENGTRATVHIRNYTKTGALFLNRLVIGPIRDRDGSGLLIVSVQKKFSLN